MLPKRLLYLGNMFSVVGLVVSTTVCFLAFDRDCFAGSWFTFTRRDNSNNPNSNSKSNANENTDEDSKTTERVTDLTSGSFPGTPLSLASTAPFDLGNRSLFPLYDGTNVFSSYVVYPGNKSAFCGSMSYGSGARKTASQICRSKGNVVSTIWSVAGLLANIGDAHTATMGGFNGRQPTQAFPGHDFSQGSQKVTMTAVSGTTMARVANGVPQGPVACSLGFGPSSHNSWMLYFKDAGGTVLGNFASNFRDDTYQIPNYTSGVQVPAGAASAWIGYFDNAQSGDATSYDDNEGNRSAAFGSTNGCKFTFNVDVTE